MTNEIRRAPRYTVDEVAAILGVDPESVRNWIRARKVKAQFTGRGAGGGYRIEHAEVERLARERWSPYARLEIPE